MLGSSQGHVDPVVLLDEVARLSSHHRDEDDVKLTALAAVDREHLVIGFKSSEPLGDGVALSVVGSDYVDTVSSESLLWDHIELLVKLRSFLELLDTEIDHIDDGLDLFKVGE